MRLQSIITGEYYHVYNRGVDKRDIFKNKKDVNRFIESILNFNQVEVVGSLKDLRKTSEDLKILSKPLVSVVVYCLNPNHFHFVLKQLIDGGIAKFMQKLQAGYTSYFNIKNSRTGALFQGTFKAHPINEENYFNKIIGYTNKNYKIHNIPRNKRDLIWASDYEYENSNFKIVSKIEGEEILKIFNGLKNFTKHCDEIVAIVKEEKDEMSVFGKE